MSVNTSTFRISGLATGLDIDSMVSKLMEAHKIPLNKLKQQKQTLAWRQEAYREINTSITKLRDKAFSMTLQTAYKVYSATSSNPDILTVNPTSTAAEGSYALTVKQLAAAASRTSATTMSPVLKSAADIDFSAPPLDLKGKDFKITFGDTTKTISWSATDSSGEFADMAALVAGLQAKIDDAFGSNQIKVEQFGTENKLVFKPANSNFLQNITLTDGTVSALPLLNFTSGSRSLIDLGARLEDLQLSTGSLTFDPDGKLNFTINGETFTIDKSATLKNLMDTVNNNANLNVKLEYLASQDKFVLTRKDTGAGKNIIVSDNNGTDFLAKIALGAQVDGANAVFDYTKNGITVTNMENASNDFTLEGISYSLKTASPATVVTFAVSKNVDTVFNNIKAFVDQYNETLDLINTKLGEKRYRDYQPLLDEQKKEMSDKDIELWEEKAKSGLLAGDKTLTALVNNLRNMWVTPVSGLNASFDQLSDLGIKTGPYTEKGKLQIDEAKLKAALTSNLDEVTKFFTNAATPLTGNGLSGNIDLSGRDFKIIWGGATYTVNLTGSYDLSTASGQQGLVDELQAKINTAVGSGNITVVLNSQKQLEFSTSKAMSFEISSGSIDALGLLGLTSGAKFDFNRRGIAGRLYRQTTESVNDLVKRAGLTALTAKNSPLSKEIDSVDDKIQKMNDKLKEYEDRYYKQFTAMEQAINKMNQQSAWFLSQISGSSGQ